MAEQHQGICSSDSKGSTGKPVGEEENPFEVDLRIQGIRQDAVLEDQGRMTKIQEVVDKLRPGYPKLRHPHFRPNLELVESKCSFF